MSHLLRKTELIVQSFNCAGVESPAHLINRDTVRKCFQVPILSLNPLLFLFFLFLIIFISGSRDLGVEGDVTEEELCMGVDPEVEAGGSQLRTGVQTLSSCWLEAGLC